jgi:2,3-dihydroxybenzoate decarboxylase
MLDQTPMIAIEEHYWDSEMARHFPPGENKSHVADPLLDLGESRLGSMDAAGIEMQVLSHGAPAAQKLAPDLAVELTQRVNDRLAEACAKRPDRFAAFAALPTPVPEKADYFPGHPRLPAPRQICLWRGDGSVSPKISMRLQDRYFFHVMITS